MPNHDALIEALDDDELQALAAAFAAAEEFEDQEDTRNYVRRSALIVALRSAPPPDVPQEPGWQPIEMAPKNARRLVGLCEGRVTWVYWDAYYAEGGRGYKPFQTGWVEADGDDVPLSLKSSPTHFYLLPAPPEAQ